MIKQSLLILFLTMCCQSKLMAKTKSKIIYHENGEIACIYKIIDDGVNYSKKCYYEDGNIYYSRSYKNGVKDGLFQEHQEDGRISSEKRYLNGALVSSVDSFYDNNIPRYISYFNCSDESCYIKGARMNYENGKIMNSYQFNKEGQMHGEVLNYHKNGRISETKIFKNGVINGKLYHYSSNGKLLLKSDYVNGLLHGESREYSHNGKLISRSIYRNNELVSSSDS